MRISKPTRRLSMIKKIVAQDSEVVIGADVHTKKHVVTVKAYGELKGAKQLPPTPEAWRSFLKSFPGCRVSVIYESGPQGYNLHDWLTQMKPDKGTKVHVYIAPPAHVPKAPGKHVKTDKRDSLSLIQAFEMKSFRPVVVPARAKREERELVRTREQAKNMQKQIKNQIHGMMKFHGVQYPGGGQWSRAWLACLETNVKTADTTGSLYFSFKAKLDLYRSTLQTIKELDKKIYETTRSGNCAATAQRIGQLTGIGRYSAAVITTEVADFAAFDNSAAFASYTGLVPRENSSGETTRRGHITKAGNRRLRRIFVECAWAWVRFDEDARRQYNRIKMGKPERARIAITAMARKLAVKTYHRVVNGPPLEKAA
jgi:transposase